MVFVGILDSRTLSSFPPSLGFLFDLPPADLFLLIISKFCYFFLTHRLVPQAPKGIALSGALDLSSEELFLELRPGSLVNYDLEELWRMWYCSELSVGKQ